MDKSQNGKAANGVAPSKEEPKQAPSQVEVTEKGELNTPALMTVEEKISKVNTLVELISKRDQIKSHLHRVEAMKFDDFDEKNVITIASQNGDQPYQIKSSYLCQKLAGVLKEEFTKRILDTEAQIAF